MWRKKEGIGTGMGGNGWRSTVEGRRGYTGDCTLQRGARVLSGTQQQKMRTRWENDTIKLGTD